MNIFEEGVSLNPSVEFAWVSFKAVGDKYQGIYIGTVKNNDGYGNPQTTYLLEQPDKTVLGVGIKDSKEQLHELMAEIQIGQYVGFVFTKEVKTGKPNPAKIIEIVTKTGAVDPKWAGKAGVNTTMVEAENGGIGHIPENLFGGSTTPSTENAPSNTTSPVVNSSEKVKIISELAKTKLNAQNAEEVKLKIKEKTGLDFSIENLDNIILQLELI